MPAACPLELLSSALATRPTRAIRPSTVFPLGSYRMTRRRAPDVTAPYAPVLPSASPVAHEAAQGVAIERAGETR